MIHPLEAQRYLLSCWALCGVAPSRWSLWLRTSLHDVHVLRRVSFLDISFPACHAACKVTELVLSRWGDWPKNLSQEAWREALMAEADATAWEP